MKRSALLSEAYSSNIHPSPLILHAETVEIEPTTFWLRGGSANHCAGRGSHAAENLSEHQSSYMNLAAQSCLPAPGLRMNIGSTCLFLSRRSPPQRTRPRSRFGCEQPHSSGSFIHDCSALRPNSYFLFRPSAAQSPQRRSR